MSTIGLLLLFLICAIILIIIFNYYNRKDTRNSKYFPFADLPPLNISQQPQFISTNLISNLTRQKNIDPDENMIDGNYQRYPLNKAKQTTSIVAVEPNQNYFPYFTAWGLEVDINAWNFIWCDSGSSYFITPINVAASPVVVIKGKFPMARYMSIYSYCGPQRTTNNNKVFGNWVTSD